MIHTTFDLMAPPMCLSGRHANGTRPQKAQKEQLRNQHCTNSGREIREVVVCRESARETPFAFGQFDLNCCAHAQHLFLKSLIRERFSLSNLHLSIAAAVAV